MARKNVSQTAVDLMGFGYTLSKEGGFFGSSVILVRPDGSEVVEEDFEKELTKLLEAPGED